MKTSGALLALAAAAAPAHGRKFYIRRAQEGGSQDDGTVSIVSGSGIEEAEIPPEESDTLTIPNYTDEQCNEWLAGAFSADGDGSNGLSEEEFHSFLAGIDDPPYVAEYFAQFEGYQSLPWLFHVVHKSLACKCEDLGLGLECCEGDDAEISFVGLKDEVAGTPEQQAVGVEYKADTCNLIAVVFQKAIDPPLPTQSPTPAPTTESPVAPAPVGPESGIAFECVDASCNSNDPSLEPESGWISLGVCGQYTEVDPCPLEYDGEQDYTEGDKVTMDPEEVPPQKMRFVFPGSVIDYSTFDYSVILDDDEANDDGIPDYYNAEQIASNEDNNGVLREVIEAFGTLATEILGGSTLEDNGDDITEEGKRNLRASSRKRQLQTMGTMDPVEVLDIPCPVGLKYAPEGVYCLEFIIKIMPDGAMANDKSLRESFEDTLNYVINQDGKLYDTVFDNNAATLVMGLGNPGNGKDYAPPPVDRSTESEEGSSGLSTGAIVGIVLLLLLVPIVLLAMYARYRKLKEEERLRRLEEMRQHNDLEADLQDVPKGGEAVEDPIPAAEPPMEAEPDDDEESSAPSEWSESSDSSSIIDPESESFAEAAEETSPTAGSALAAMGALGVAASMSPGKKKKEFDFEDTDDKAEMRAEITALAKECDTSKSPEDLLKAYEGKEEVLLSHLRTMKDSQAKDGDRAVVAPLMGPDGAPPTNIDEELLSKMKKKQEEGTPAAAAAALDASAKAGDKAKPPADIDEELLSKMKKKQEEGTPAAAALAPTKSIAKVKSSSSIDKELLSKMQEKKETTSISPKKDAGGKPFDEPAPAAAPAAVNSDFLAFMSAQKAMEGTKKSAPEKKKEDPKAKMRAEITALVEECKPGKSAPQLLKAYAGREDELLRNLKKLKASKSEA